nr:carotenoid biosynthesis protein [uncultured Holophaga sp.]
MTLRFLAITLLLALACLGCSWLLCAWVPGASLALVAGNLGCAVALLAHATRTLGWPRALLQFGLGVGLTFLLEALSLATGLATPYTYTAVLGPRFLGVPVVIPLGWSSMLYLSHGVANLLVDGRVCSLRRGSARLVPLALLTALIMTSWDLTLDPCMVYQLKAWVWQEPTGFLGIPFANFVSWMELTFIINLCFRVAERDLPPPTQSPSPGFVLILPILYGLTGLSGCFLGLPGGLSVLPPFTMGIATLGALGGPWRSRWAAQVQTSPGRGEA